ncbi:MAG: outer membrane beta-barrel protein [Bacteroidetes bacterium]|nr:outer membrane beta-barrel protein [Bacteroidota bacterium]
MKKITAILAIFASSMLFSQAKFALKGHVLMPTESSTWKDITGTLSNAIDEKGKNSVGYNVGLSGKFSLAGTFFFMPEIYYTEFKNEWTIASTNTTLIAKNKRVDVPLLAGMDLIGNYFGVFAGPVAIFKLKNNHWYNDYQEIRSNGDFTLGYQLGGQITIEKFILSGRYQGAFKREERNFINQQTGHNIQYDNSPNQLLLGIGYQF